MNRYMLDTNTVSHLLRKNPKVVEKVMTLPMSSLCISAITEGELLFGLAKRPENKKLAIVVREFLKRVNSLPWDSVVADRYGPVKAEIEKHGRIVAPLDLLIATHALAISAVMVTNDGAFRHVAELELEDWTL